MCARILPVIHTDRERGPLSIIYLHREREGRGETARTHSIWSQCSRPPVDCLFLSFRRSRLPGIIPDDSSCARPGSTSRFRSAETGGHVRDLSETLNFGQRPPHIQMEMPSRCVISFRSLFFFFLCSSSLLLSFALHPLSYTGNSMP